ncbi:MAG: HlyD family efflux transporter periplasmic adaptor subunit [Planctomycetota bacterium]
MPRFCLIALVVMMTGCEGVSDYLNTRSDDASSRSASEGDGPVLAELARVRAQGTLQPERGVLALMAPPGDRVSEILVSTGDQVETDQVLVELESFSVRQIELEVARTKIAEGEVRLAAETSAAEAKLAVARTGLAQAELQLQQARDKRRLAETDGGSLDLLRRAAELGERKLDQLRDARGDATARRLVSANQLDEETLKVSQARLQFENARTEFDQAIEAGELQVESAREEIRAAELAIEATRASNPIGGLKQQVDLLEMKAATSRLVSPLKGRVLSIDAITGQATTTMPLMHLADTSRMVCHAEVNVGDLPRVSPGQRAVIDSPGLANPIAATVNRIEPRITTPSLASPFPLAPVDRHTAKVVLLIDEDDTAAAAALLQLQVEVTIEIED